MTTTRFNAITYSNRLKNAVDIKEMAEIQAEELSNLINNDLVTKQDLRNELTLLENRIVIRLGAIMMTCTALISITLAIVGFLLKGS